MASARQHEALGFLPDRRVFIPNGFVVGDYADDARLRSQTRRDWGFGDGDLIVGLAARYHPMKDHENFLDAAARTASQNDRVRFVLAGLGVDTRNAALQQRILALGLSDRVRLIGEQKDMSKFYPALDIAVLSSAWGEGFPNVLGEAMAAGRPCVTTDVGDAAEVVSDTGYRVPPGDAAALAAALSRLAGNPSERARLGRLARTRITLHYSLPAIVQQYADLYSAAAANSSTYP
jgi:glycosyltransferase involved in cell wall biosynthesis